MVRMRYECVNQNGEIVYVKATNNGHPVEIEDDGSARRVQLAPEMIRMFPELDTRPIVRVLEKGEPIDDRFPVWKKTTKPKEQ